MAVSPKELLALTLRAPEFLGVVQEHRFHEPEEGEKRRQWRFDYAWPELRVGLEYEGGTFARGPSRHTTGAGFSKDCEKYSVAAIQGWIVVRVDAPMVRSGLARKLVALALEAAKVSAEARKRHTEKGGLYE